MSQLELFRAPPAAVMPVCALGGMPRSVANAWERAYSLEVRQAFLDVFVARPGEWLDHRDYPAVIDKYRISCCFGHALGAMARAGMLEAKNRYFGSERPGDGNYKGYTTLYRFRVPMAGVAFETISILENHD